MNIREPHKGLSPKLCGLVAEGGTGLPDSPHTWSLGLKQLFLRPRSCAFTGSGNVHLCATASRLPAKLSVTSGLCAVVFHDC